MLRTEYPDIERDATGTLYVTDSGYKVLPLIVDHVAWKLDAVQIAAQHRGLSLADLANQVTDLPYGSTSSR